ncbi:hypothetical protein BBD42_02725 [Paenibacillus sp. BIHB 4019]|uniref:HTH araC/xylS-type domain-containing protein n=1 Tax=Paenibacillus sp. BIHB 4019 TaxID=1870819 RepID=A0A1B2DCR3_9BACL|nr:helix-turn-helix domain-containing protein [Paenibacillus sp. BIHB 4019]ANY65498.1 hypothetical protein BBD42_02725 [Paenibacillus sp. BIHB 4019]
MSKVRAADHERIAYICRLIYDAYKMPVCYIKSDGVLESEFLSSIKSHPLLKDRTAFLQKLYHEGNAAPFPILETTAFSERYIGLHVLEEDEHQGTIIIGPVISLAPSEATIGCMLHDYQLPSNYQEEFLDYYKSLRVVNDKQVINLSLLAYFLLYNRRLDQQSIIDRSHSSLPYDAVEVESEVHNSLFKKRMENTFYMDYVQECYTWDLLQAGDKKKLIEHLDNFPIGGSGILSKKSYKRSQKNLAIVCIAIAARRAIESGLHTEIAYTMSDYYIQQVEETNDTTQPWKIMKDCCIAFFDKINLYKTSSNSKSVQLCKEYIFSYIFKEITIAELANQLNLNPVYLSQLFKKETGTPLGTYIQQQKIEEAKKMLLHSQHSISSISSSLNFNDQSYFTTVFKRLTGQTPSQFRNRSNPANNQLA